MTRFTKIYTWLFLASCLMISCSSYDFSGVFSTLPAKPQAGEIVTLLYNPTGTILEGSNQVSAIVRTYADRDLQPASMFSMPNNVLDTEEYKMKRKQDGWLVEILVPDSVVGLVVTLHNETDTDYSDGLGYWVPLHTSDQHLLPGAEAGYAAALVRRGWGAKLDKTLYADTLLGFIIMNFPETPLKRQTFHFLIFPH